jgi:hypothetical protein
MTRVVKLMFYLNLHVVSQHENKFLKRRVTINIQEDQSNAM